LQSIALNVENIVIIEFLLFNTKQKIYMNADIGLIECFVISWQVYQMCVRCFVT